MKYFLHDSNARNDEKLTLLFIEYGYEGLGLFYTILEILASQEKPVNEKVLKSQLNIRKRLEKQLLFMYKIEVLSIKNGDVFSENLLNFSEKYQIKKEKTRKKVSEWREKQKDINNVTSYKVESNRPKVKESKVNRSKVKENKYIPTFEVFKKYALEKKPSVNIDSLKLKYDAWVENDWKTGMNKPIKNWKTTLLNTIDYLKESQKSSIDEAEELIRKIDLRDAERENQRLITK